MIATHVTHPCLLPLMVLLIVFPQDTSWESSVFTVDDIPAQSLCRVQHQDHRTVTVIDSHTGPVRGASPTAGLAQKPGQVVVIDPSGSRWQPQAEVAAGNGQPDDHFGGAVALSDNTALIGAGFTHRETGTAYVFVHRGQRLVQQAQLSVGGAMAGDHVGTTVALDGKTALVGAMGTATYTGAAYVFVEHGTQWIEQARLIASDGAPRDWFGRSVALSGDTALVSAWFAHNDRGTVYVFHRHGTHWTEEARLTAGDAQPEDYFGTAVALDGSTAVVGAAGQKGNRGAAYVFVRQGTQWVEQTRLTACAGQTDGIFGTAVAVSGNTIVVGAAGQNHSTGVAYVFGRQGGHWREQAQLVANDGAAQNWFGRSVALSGNTALVGAWFTHDNAGSAYLFGEQDGQWREQAVLSAGDGLAPDWFGNAVALNGQMALVGAGFAHRAAGAAYVFVCDSTT